MSERMDGWRECADPVELAAAVAAGVEVLCVAVDGRTWETGCEDSESFRRCMANGCRYRVPPSWSWSYEPPTTVTGDDLPERRVWTCKIGGRVGRLSGGADAPMRRAVADAFTAETGYPVEFCFSGWGDDLDESELAVVEDRAPDPEAIRAALVKRLTALPTPEPPGPVGDLRERIKATLMDNDHPTLAKSIEGSYYDRMADAVLAVLPPTPTPPPAPPWPGAVLSGLCDEDGVPTWLAQAGQVPGEQVRQWRGDEWLIRGYLSPWNWVEVRAPEPETERVNVLDAIRNRIELTHPEGEFLAVGVELREDGDLVAIEQQEPWGKAQPVAPDGTVEVLMDGDR